MIDIIYRVCVYVFFFLYPVRNTCGVWLSSTVEPSRVLLAELSLEMGQLDEGSEHALCKLYQARVELRLDQLVFAPRPSKARGGCAASAYARKYALCSWSPFIGPARWVDTLGGGSDVYGYIGEHGQGRGSGTSDSELVLVCVWYRYRFRY